MDCRILAFLVMTGPGCGLAVINNLSQVRLDDNLFEGFCQALHWISPEWRVCEVA